MNLLRMNGIWSWLFTLVTGAMVCCTPIAAEQDAASFYGVSSLIFYMDRLFPGDTKETICDQETVLFAEKDLEELWEISAAHPVLMPLILQARNQYELALEYRHHPDLFNQFVRESRALLEQAWKQVYPYFSHFRQQYDPLLMKQCSELNEEQIHENFLCKDAPKWVDRMPKEMVPYLLPIDSPIRESLNAIFSSPSVLKNAKSFGRAGFEILMKSDQKEDVCVGKHPNLPGYVVKVYLDTAARSKANEAKNLKRRCDGAQYIRQLIRDKNLQHFLIPDKWLFIPSYSDQKSRFPKVILVETDMQIVSENKSAYAWKTKVTKEHIEELYCIFSHGHASAALAKNIPYTVDGKFACIDTEVPIRVINYEKAKAYLSKEMASYLDELVRKRGRKAKK